MEEPELESEEASGNGAAWMATFADMMTLLLCFFILLLSFATMDIVKFRDAMGSVQQALGVQFEHDGEFEAVASSPLQLDPDEGSGAIGEDRALLAELDAAIAEEGLETQIAAEIDGRGVVVRINGQVLYQPGEAALKAESETILRRISGLVRASRHRVMIEGHTDNTPIRTARYPSNWELSTARAIAAMRFLVDQRVEAERIGVAGYADQKPIQPNDSAVNRAANRRVEFVFIRDAPPEEDGLAASNEGSRDEDQPEESEASSEGTEPSELETEPATASL